MPLWRSTASGRPQTVRLAQSYAARFLHMMFAFPTQPYNVDPVLSRALEKVCDFTHMLIEPKSIKQSS